MGEPSAESEQPASLWRFWNTPLYDEYERSRRARLIHAFALWLIALVIISVFLAIAVQPSLVAPALLTLARVVPVFVVVLLLNRAGLQKAAGLLLIVGPLLLVALTALRAGGVRSPGVQFFFVLSMMSALVIGRRAGILTGVACILISYALATLEAMRMLPIARVNYNVWTLATLNAMYVAFFVFALLMSMKALRDALSRRESELRQRRIAERQLELALESAYRAEGERERLLTHLGERVKEQRLLLFASRLVDRSTRIDETFLAALVERIPAAWMYPGCCEARIRYQDTVVETPAFRDAPPKLAVSFATSEGEGALEVVYTDERPTHDEGPFLVEERLVLESLAEMLKSALERSIHERARKRAQEELERHHRQLEELVAQRTEELRAARDAAHEASRAKSRFLANMSHEIRTPMNAVLGFAQLLLRNPDTTPEQRRQLEAISRAGDHLMSLIDGILQIAKVEAGRIEVQNTLFDVWLLVSDLGRLFTPRAEEKGIALSVRRAESVPRYIRADEGKIRQVLSNLIGNAIKFTSRGRVTIALAVRRAPNARLSIDVEDSGAGIAAEELEDVFAMFEQTASGRASGEGTGLGLAISQELARVLGGEIRVQSRVGEGTVFSFEVPFEEVAACDAPSGGDDASLREGVLAPGGEGMQASPGEDSALTPKALEPIPEELRQKLRDATMRAEIDRMRTLLELARGFAPEAAEALRAHAERYAYERILELLEPTLRTRPAAEARALERPM